MSAIYDSVVGRAFQNSRIVSWWSAKPSCSAPLAGSFFLRRARLIFTALFVVAIAAVIAICAVRISTVATIALSGCIIAGLLFPYIAIALLPAALIWSPRFYLTPVADESIFVRLDHGLVLGMLLFLTLRPGVVRNDTVYGPLLLFLSIMTGSVLTGVIGGTIPTPIVAYVYLIHLVYLSAVFVCARSLAGGSGPSLEYAWTAPILAAGAYGVVEWYLESNALAGYRTFERGYFDRQANHFAGLFAFSLPVAYSFIYARRPWLGGLFGLAVGAGLLTTGSREGLVAVVAGSIAWFALAAPRATLTCLAVALPFVFGLVVVLFSEITAPGTSLDARFIAWASALTTFTDHPILGLGLGARHRSYYDNQYLHLLAETGVAGLAAFLYWTASYLRRLVRTPTRARAAALKGVAFAGAIAVFVQGFAASTFVVTVIAGPLLWLVGVALSDEHRRDTEELPS